MRSVRYWAVDELAHGRPEELPARGAAKDGI
jgi:hypothetical protein